MVISDVNAALNVTVNVSVAGGVVLPSAADVSAIEILGVTLPPVDGLPVEPPPPPPQPVKLSIKMVAILMNNLFILSPFMS